MTLLPHRELHGTALVRYTKFMQETTSNFLKLLLDMNTHTQKKINKFTFILMSKILIIIIIQQ